MKFAVGAGIAVFKEGEVLLGRRLANSGNDLESREVWTFPGGKLDMGETVLACAIRELEEETGLKAREDDLKFVSIADYILPTVQQFIAGFLLTEFSGEPRAMEPEKISEWKWFPLDALPENLFFPSRKLLETLARVNPEETNRAYYRA